MRRFARAAVMAAAVITLTGPMLVGAGVASAVDMLVPMSQYLRRCDFSPVKNIGGAYYGRAAAQVRVEDGDVVAYVSFATGKPGTAYDVRLIQVPRSTGCSAGDPGVAAATLITDGAGAGTATLRVPLLADATGAWVSMTRPNPHSQHPEEFYTSDFVVAL